MSRRWIGLCALMLLAGCGGEASQRADGAGTAQGAAADDDDGKAECMTGGGEQWAHDCLVERNGDMLTIRHPDGGFRRFRVLADGHGLEAADGAEPARLRIIGDQRIEVAAGIDRYRLPAQIGSAGQ